MLGNPPYYAFSGVSPEEEEGLVEPYKKGLVAEWKIRKFNLDELYVRFLRLAERRIAEMSKRGIVCYVSSYSYLNDPSFVVVRKRFLKEFQHIWIDCLNGDSRETGKRTPDDEPDPSVFSTEYNKAGIRLGTAIGLFAKTGEDGRPQRSGIGISGAKTNAQPSTRLWKPKKTSMGSTRLPTRTGTTVSLSGRQSRAHLSALAAGH